VSEIKAPYRILSLFVSCLLLTSCSSEFSDFGHSLRGGGLGSGLGTLPPTDVGAHESGAMRTGLFPWENWPLGSDLKGGSLNEPLIVEGDEFVKRGERQNALPYYLKARSSQLSFPVKEALALRIASTQLTLDQAKEALVTLSQFSRENALDVSVVEENFSMVFAYAYGRVGDIDQSLAWFSRLNRMGKGRSAVSQDAAQGVSLLIRTIDDDNLINLGSIWSSDQFVASMIGQERSRRNRLGETYAKSNHTQPFWTPLIPQTTLSALATDPLHPQGKADAAIVGSLLPLSGRYSNLGQSTLRGMELAFLESGVRLLAKDDLGEPQAAASVLDSLLMEGTPTVVIGPLLSDSADVTAPMLRDRGIPQLSLSRKELPSFGGNVFQLGASTSSQVESLLNVTSKAAGIQRYAIVYPQDTSGFDFVREFRRHIAEMGLGLSFEASYGEDYRQSFVTVAENLEKTDVQGIFFPDDIDKATVLLSNFSPAFRKKVKILGSAAWDNPQKISSSRTILEGAIFVSPFFNKSSRELVVRFNDVYKKRHGIDADFLAAQGFDAATLALAAITRQEKEGTPFLAGFRAIENYEGLTGQISVLPSGQFRRIFSVVELTDKGFREFDSSLIRGISTGSMVN